MLCWAAPGRTWWARVWEGKAGTEGGGAVGWRVTGGRAIGRGCRAVTHASLSSALRVCIFRSVFALFFQDRFYCSHFSLFCFSIKFFALFVIGYSVYTSFFPVFLQAALFYRLHFKQALL